MRLAALLALSLAFGCAPFSDEDEKLKGNAMLLVQADGQLTTLLQDEALPEWRIIYASGESAGTVGDVFTENEVWRMPEGGLRARFSTAKLIGPRGVPPDITAALANLRIVPSSTAPFDFPARYRANLAQVDICLERSPIPWEWVPQGRVGNFELSGACTRSIAQHSPACATLCLPSCGDRYIDVPGGEECDPPNGGQCLPNCTRITCGNGVLEPGEECDFGAANSSTRPGACHDCKLPKCGDGIVDPGERCDTRGPTSTCGANCTPSDCGDRTIQAGEACDDGNSDDGDECTNQCLIPHGTPMLRTSSASVAFSPVFPGIENGGGPEFSLHGMDFRFLGHDVQSLTLLGTVISFGAPSPAASSGTFRQPGAINLWAPDSNLDHYSVATSTIIGVAPARAFVLDIANGSVSTQVVVELRLYETTNIVELYFGPRLAGWAFADYGPAWQAYDGGRGEYLICCGPFRGYEGWPTSTRFTLEPYLAP